MRILSMRAHKQGSIMLLTRFVSVRLLKFALRFGICLKITHRQGKAASDVASPREGVLAALIVAGCLVFKVGIECTATDAHRRFGYAQRRIGYCAERGCCPLPNVAD